MGNVPEDWTDEPQYEAHPYYAEWKHDFLLVGCMRGKRTTLDARNRVKQWILDNARDRCYMVGERVSMMNDADATHFMLVWG